MIRTNPPRLEHLRRLTDSKGLIHAAIGDCPDRSRGYEAIDNADALRLCAEVSAAVRGDLVHSLAKICFDFLSRGRRYDGRVYHACDSHGAWRNNGDDGLVQSRLARALAAVLVSELPIAMRLMAANWWRELIVHADDARSPRAAGNWLVAIGGLRAADPGRDLERARMLANWLADECYATARRGDWEWFGPAWELGAACIPAGLWHAGAMLDSPQFMTVAESTTRFLLSQLFKGDVFNPPGTHSEWAADAPRAAFDQRPADVAAVVELLCAAERISGCGVYGTRAEQAAGWFAGHNVKGMSLIDLETGGCHDALVADGLHPDQGGAAVAAYLLTEALRAARAAARAEPPVYVVPINC